MIATTLLLAGIVKQFFLLCLELLNIQELRGQAYGGMGLRTDIC
jgi:hypothetical protein